VPGAKFYPRSLILSNLLIGALTLLWGGAWVVRNSAAVSENMGLPTFHWVFALISGLLGGIGGISAVVFVMPLLHRYLRRRPTLELNDDGLIFVLGLGKAQHIAWGTIAGVKAKKLNGPLGLGGVVINLEQEHRSFGKELFIPHLFLDKDVDYVASAIDAQVPKGRRAKKGDE
jgi:hypothetical protein